MSFNGERDNNMMDSALKDQTASKETTGKHIGNSGLQGDLNDRLGDGAKGGYSDRQGKGKALLVLASRNLAYSIQVWLTESSYPLRPRISCRRWNKPKQRQRGPLVRESESISKSFRRSNGL